MRLYYFADILTSPILIIVRIVKHLINMYFIDKIKDVIKWLFIEY